MTEEILKHSLLRFTARIFQEQIELMMDYNKIEAEKRVFKGSIKTKFLGNLKNRKANSCNRQFSKFESQNLSRNSHNSWYSEKELHISSINS